MKSGDFIILPTADRVTYLWRVIGVYHGGIGQESLVGLVPVINTPGYADGKTREEMFVPWALVCDHAYQRIVGSGTLKGSQ